jgi:hypothetical protein
MEKCDVSHGAYGTGIQVHGGGTLDLKESLLHDETKFAVMVGEAGTLRAVGTLFANNGVAGLAALEGSQTELSACRIENNGNFGIQIGGVLRATGCVIQKHSQCGVFVQTNGQFGDEQNQYAENGQTDVNNQ